MVNLDDPLWSSLTHAHGPASDIPDMLRALAGSTEPSLLPNSEPWFGLWSSLCHQEDVYDASYAAVPHIVDLACRAKGPIDNSFFQLPAAVEVSRCNGRGPTLSPLLEDAYLEALARLMDCVSAYRAEPWDQYTLISVMCAQAVSKGHVDVAEALFQLDKEIIDRLIVREF